MVTELSKAEKLRKRQEQLAKWKLKKAPTATPEPNVENPGRPKLVDQDGNAGEKDKGETNEVAQSINDVNNNQEKSDDGLSTEERRHLERQRKLEEWKRKKQQKQDLGLLKPKSENSLQRTKPESTVVAKNLFAGLKSKKQLTPKRLFGDEEETETPVFKKPLLTKDDYAEEDTGDVDPLDAYLASLDLSSTTSKIVVVILDEEEEEAEQDDAEGTLLNQKIKNLQKGKELTLVDHEKVQYMPFRKSFYVEPQSIASLTEEEVAAIRLEMDAIKVSGKNCPRPIWSFAQLGLSSLVISIMEDKLDYTKPTSIQSQALPAIMSGRDFLGIAKTGSGKTLAFVLPLLKHVQDQPPLAKGDGPIAILLSPTRELALQIYKQLTNFTKKLGISACCCYGGSSIEPQIAELKKGAQVVVSTPGRLIDLIAANNGRVCNLQRVTYVVLDEADRMFDFGFEPQVTKIFSQIRPDKQSILFSATFAKKLELLARLTLVDPVECVVGGISVVAPEITQKVIFFERTDDTNNDKFNKLVEIVKLSPAVKHLIFVETQDGADRLLVQLLARDIVSLALHGGKDQLDRRHAIREFSAPNSNVDVLVATSVAARGLDVKGLDVVINYDPPSHMEDYVHRVGRTGRASRLGTAYTFVVSDQERPITDVVKALRLSKVPETDIDPRLVEIADRFLGKVKAGTEKFRFGFGGHGLGKLDEIRARAKENQNVDENGRKIVSQVPDQKVASSETPSESLQIDLLEFVVIEGRAEETAGPDRCKFHLRITINDLPQKARWTVVNADNLAEVIEATSTSITNKGQYYAPNTKVPATVKVGGREVPAPPKLYLLIEGLTEKAVGDANRMIRQKMIEGLELAAKEEGTAPSGKYTV